MYNSPFEVSPQYNFQPPYWSSAIRWDSLLWPLGSSLESGGPSPVISQWQMEGICFSLVFTYCVEFSVGWYGACPHRSSRPSLVLRMSSQRMALLGESYAVTMISGNWKSNWAIPLDDFPVHHFRGLSFGGRELVVAVNGSGISHSLANMGDYLLVRCIYSRYRIGCFLQGSISLHAVVIDWNSGGRSWNAGCALWFSSRVPIGLGCCVSWSASSGICPNHSCSGTCLLQSVDDQPTIDACPAAIIACGGVFLQTGRQMIDRPAPPTGDELQQNVPWSIDACTV